MFSLIDQRKDTESHISHHSPTAMDSNVYQESFVHALRDIRNVATLGDGHRAEAFVS